MLVIQGCAFMISKDVLLYLYLRMCVHACDPRMCVHVIQECVIIFMIQGCVVMLVIQGCAFMLSKDVLLCL